MDEFKRFLELKIEHFETESANARLEKNVNSKRKANIRLGVYKGVLSAYTKLGCSSRT